MVLGHSNFFINSEKTIQYHSILVSLHFLHLGFSTAAKIHLDGGKASNHRSCKQLPVKAPDQTGRSRIMRHRTMD